MGMLLVVDANILFSALISHGETFDLLCSEELQLAAPEFLLVELSEHKAEILQKSSLPGTVFEEFLELLRERIEIVPHDDFGNFMSEAANLSPDPDDIPYIALALKLRCPIWSQDSRLKRQSRVQVYTTRELLELLGL